MNLIKNLSLTGLWLTQIGCTFNGLVTLPAPNWLLNQLGLCVSYWLVLNWLMTWIIKSLKSLSCEISLRLGFNWLMTQTRIAFNWPVTRQTPNWPSTWIWLALNWFAIWLRLTVIWPVTQIRPAPNWLTIWLGLNYVFDVFKCFTT